MEVRNLKEVTFRVKQMLWNKMDLIRSSRNSRSRIPRDPVKAKGGEHSFFVRLMELESIAMNYRNFFPGRQGAILERSERVRKHRFSVLGCTELSWEEGGEINWHRDPVNGKEAPRIWWQKIDCLENQVVGDPKVIWELNRHQHFVLLGIAYLLSGSERYHEEYLCQLTSWIDSNPPKKGINWASSLELAFRCIAWAWSYHLFGGETKFPEESFLRFLSFLARQGEHIERNLSIYHSPNTHLTGEALGLFYLGVCFPYLRDAAKWVEIGKKVLLQEVQRQVLDDGGYMERSIWYHRYTLDIYLHFYLLARMNGIDLSEDVESAIQRLGEFLVYCSRPDRSIPLIGDDDGGRLLALDSLRSDDLRGIFSTLAVLFGRGDFKFLSDEYQEETFWLLGAESKAAYEEIEVYEPPFRSMAFSKTGYFFMRNSWSKHDNYLAFDCGPHGWLNCGHAHADLLSFQIQSGYQPIIVDPGTFTYAGELRNYFRDADRHSTIKVDSFYPAVPGGPFSWRLTPQYKFLGWSTGDRFDYVCGRVTTSRGWSHVRALFFIKPSLYVIWDSLRGKGKHEVEITFPLYGKAWETRGGECRLLGGEIPCSIQCVSHRDFDVELRNTWLSLSYGHRMPSYTLLIRGDVDLPERIVFLVNVSCEDYTVEIGYESNRPSFEIISKRNKSKIFSYGNFGEVN
jgi:hypothetical protein